MGEIVQLRDGPTVADIAGQLRQMADMIDDGEVEATSVLFIIEREGDFPDVFGWGEHLGDYGNIAVCELAKQFFIMNKTAR